MQERLGVSGARPPEGAHTAAEGEGLPVSGARPPEGAHTAAEGEGTLVSAARPPEGAPVGAADGSAPGALRQALARAERRGQWRGVRLTVPPLPFLLLPPLLPMAALRLRAVETPEVARALPGTIRALDGWDRRDAPPAAAYAALVRDLADLP